MMNGKFSRHETPLLDRQWRRLRRWFLFFQKGYFEPAWEDSQNVSGGKSVLTLPKNGNKSERIDEYWLQIVLALAGETMDETGDQINGAVVSIRRSNDRLALWTSGTTDKRVCVALGFRKPFTKSIAARASGFELPTHKATAESGRSFRNEP
jgi:translation initiation factor 4E